MKTEKFGPAPLPPPPMLPPDPPADVEQVFRHLAEEATRTFGPGLPPLMPVRKWWVFTPGEVPTLRAVAEARTAEEAVRAVRTGAGPLAACPVSRLAEEPGACACCGDPLPAIRQCPLCEHHLRVLVAQLNTADLVPATR